MPETVVSARTLYPGEPPTDPNSLNGNRIGYPDFSPDEMTAWLERFPANPPGNDTTLANESLAITGGAAISAKTDQSSD